MGDDIELRDLLSEIRSCTACSDLPLGPNPVVSASGMARVLIVGQAPGVRVHETGIPWNDPSGVRLREWLCLSEAEFYNTANVAIVPMGFCYPGKAASGDLPPRPECASLWRSKLHSLLPNIKLTLLVGQYAQRYYLGSGYEGVTATVSSWRRFLPDYLPLPHPSPRNNIWLRKNSWFENEVLPELRKRVARLLGNLRAETE